MTPPDRLVALAPAKVNLGLEVTSRRRDGYHEVVTIMQAVSLADRFEWSATGGPFSYLGAPGVPADADLVVRALELAPDREQWTGELRLIKQIPTAAGLAGGSSDAALALRLALLDDDDATLAGQAARLGSDVPFFLGSAGRSLATGTGTTLEPLPSSALWVVLVTPDLAIVEKTAGLYRGLVPSDFSDGSTVRGLATGKMWPREIPNAFLRQLLGYPVVRYAYDCLWRAGATRVSASGAGPTIFALATTEAEAAAIAERLPNDAGAACVAHALDALERDAARRMALALRGRRN